jgi:predicted Rossmann fold flavoprotein
VIFVVGAGAAGLMAAIHAARAGRDVTLVERTTDGGRKILISGGGRCNILPSRLQPERFVTDSRPHHLRAMLRSWPLEDQRRFFESDVGLPLSVEVETGKLFPASNRARDVRDGLVRLARARGVRLAFDTWVTDVRPDSGRWLVQTTHGERRADVVVLATGGLSVPRTGSDGTGLGIATRLGHRVHDTYPALTPLTTPPNHPHAALAGVSLPVRIRAKDEGRVSESRGGFLFTHRGYSGPAVLDISHVAVRSRMAGRAATIRVAWSALDAGDWTRLLTGGDAAVATLLGRRVPARLAEALMAESGVPTSRRTAALPRVERTALVERLTSYLLPWAGDEGYQKAEVTGGGVDLGEVDAQTLESRRHPGLYLCGEILDAFGPIGGYNFAWAWATGRSAGQAIAKHATTE